MKRIISMIVLICMLGSLSAIGTNAYEVDDRFLEAFYDYCITVEPYAPDKMEIWDAKEVDDVFVFTGYPKKGAVLPLDGSVSVFGSFVVANIDYYATNDGFCMFAYDGENFYTLTEAWNEGLVTDLSEFESFGEPIYITRIGDANRDKKIDVRDATALQKHLAGIESPDWATDNRRGVLAVFDFNRDVAVNVKDATAIQKHIAGLEV